MKKMFLLLLTALSLSPMLLATVRTVSNNPSTLAQFNTIQAAVDASSSGDTVYVHASPNAYASFTISNKRLTVIGPGWSPDKNIPLTAVISGTVTLTGAGTAGTELQGLSFSATINIATLGVDNIRFIRNRLNQGQTFSIFPSVAGTVSGYLFEGNWIDNSQITTNTSYTIQNFIFQNNIFYESGCCLHANISGFFNTVNVIFDHNLWYGPGAGTRDAFAGNSRFLILSNNIFVRRNAANNVSNSTFTNNITFNAGNNSPWLVSGNVDGGGNAANQDPEMADQASVNGGTNDPLLNFTIAAGPANNSGSDGKDMGLLFDASGSLNWNNSRNARIPRIFSMNITTPTVAPGGNLSVTVESRTSN